MTTRAAPRASPTAASRSAPLRTDMSERGFHVPPSSPGAARMRNIFAARTFRSSRCRLVYSSSLTRNAMCCDVRLLVLECVRHSNEHVYGNRLTCTVTAPRVCFRWTGVTAGRRTAPTGCRAGRAAPPAPETRPASAGAGSPTPSPTFRVLPVCRLFLHKVKGKRTWR